MALSPWRSLRQSFCLAALLPRQPVAAVMAVAGVRAAASPAVEASAAIISWSEPDGLDRRASPASIASHVTAAQALSNAIPTAAARSKCPMVLTAGSRQGVELLSRKAKSPFPSPFASEETVDVTTGGNWIDNLVSLVLLQCEVMWCPGAESNHRHCDFQSHALPTELPGRHQPGEGCNRRGYRKAADGCPALYAGFTRRPLRPSIDMRFRRAHGFVMRDRWHHEHERRSDHSRSRSSRPQMPDAGSSNPPCLGDPPGRNSA